MWQLVDNLPPSVVAMEGDINCHVEEEDNNINVSTQLTVEISQDKESEFNEKFNVVFPTFKGQCLNAKDFKLVKEKLIAEIENSLNPTQAIKDFLNQHSNILNCSQERQLVKMINSE